MTRFTHPHRPQPSRAETWRDLLWRAAGTALALGLIALAAMPAKGGDQTDGDGGAMWHEAEQAAAAGDCGSAEPIYRQILSTGTEPADRIDATHGLVLCVATPDDPWAARELMADLLPVVLQHHGPASPGLVRHHSIWAEAEVRAGALDVAWRRAEAAILASHAAGHIDPFDHAAEIYRLAAIQLARGQGDAFIVFLQAEMQRLTRAHWAALDDGPLFMELTAPLPETADPAVLQAWVRAGLQDLDPRPLYLALLGEQPA
ncbi:MAG: hypothetical protein AAF677_09895 [Pseudomonadota bacterium]